MRLLSVCWVFATFVLPGDICSIFLLLQLRFLGIRRWLFGRTRVILQTLSFFLFFWNSEELWGYYLFVECLPFLFFQGNICGIFLLLQIRFLGIRRWLFGRTRVILKILVFFSFFSNSEELWGYCLFVECLLLFFCQRYIFGVFFFLELRFLKTRRRRFWKKVAFKIFVFFKFQLRGYRLFIKDLRSIFSFTVKIFEN